VRKKNETLNDLSNSLFYWELKVIIKFIKITDYYFIHYYKLGIKKHFGYNENYLQNIS